MTSYLFYYQHPAPNPLVSPTTTIPWSCTVQQYKPISPSPTQPSSEFYLFNYENVPDKSFMCAVPPSSTALVLEADKEIQLILEKTKTHSKHQTYTITVCNVFWF